MSEMIERATLTLCAKSMGTLAQPVAERIVRTVIEAMREPTEAMVYAASNEDGPTHAKITWHDMIDAALK